MRVVDVVVVGAVGAFFAALKGISYESIRFRIGAGRIRACSGLDAAILAISNGIFSTRIVTDDSSIGSRKVQSKHPVDVVVVGGLLVVVRKKTLRGKIMKEILQRPLGRFVLFLDKYTNGPYVISVTENGIVRSSSEYQTRKDALLAFKQFK